ncbi:hypothetical protein Pint_35237 [Pistacia integerrima]|uniref:Uncharacterized protein n=1 Tax=Pistacia integerrima TaxID=434235 RepID=A0ACC0Y0V7_9ROSI|nr:hypothetical protein Pint_35237 [Pistacia integerrima]
MIGTMDLNASPLPEEDEDTFEGHIEQYAVHERAESGAEILRREREERRMRLKRDRPDDRNMHDQYFQPRRFKSYEKNKLPPGWLDCPPSGSEIDCMIPSKVPLGESFNDCIPPGKRYSFKQVIHQQRVSGRKVSQIIVSLTFPFICMIQCKGRDSVPDNPSVNSFVYEVTQFLIRQKHSKKYILVHCTHGHNRTGYMIVHYLNAFTTNAIKRFADARPPGIYKRDYIDALYAFYHERRPDTIEYPIIPEWKRPSEFDLNGEAVPDDDDDDGGSTAPLNDNHEVQVEMTNDDVLGDEIPNDQLLSLRNFCYQMLKLDARVGKKYDVSWVTPSFSQQYVIYWSFKTAWIHRYPIVLVDL